MRKMMIAVAALTLTACTTAHAGCHYDKVKLGMSETDVTEVCGCGEPDERVEKKSKDGDRVELTFRPEHSGSYGWYTSGVTVSNGSYTPPPRTSSDTLTVTLEGGHVTSVSKDTTWTGVSR